MFKAFWKLAEGLACLVAEGLLDESAESFISDIQARLSISLPTDHLLHHVSDFGDSDLSVACRSHTAPTYGRWASQSRYGAANTQSS